MGIINLSTNIKDGGPGVRNAILEIVGGVMVEPLVLCDSDYHLGRTAHDMIMNFTSPFVFLASEKYLAIAF